MLIDENELIKRLSNAKKVLLIEPNYPSDYPPLGLAKIKAFLNSKGIESVFSRRMIPDQSFDLIVVCTVFTYYSKYVFDVIKNRGIIHRDTPILVGGVMASIIPDAFDRFSNLFVYRGYSKILDGYKPDYDIIHKETQWDDYSFIFTSRGCPNKCAYCVVWKIEKERWVNPDWKKMIDLSKPNIMISDNNLSSISLDHLKDIVKFVTKHKKKVLFNSGFDCKYITPEIASELSKVSFIKRGMRMAFDRIEEDGIFQKSVKMLIDAGIPKSAFLVYVLFNFTDRPKDAYYRATECQKLGIRPYPQCYRPFTSMTIHNRFVGKYWTRRLCRAFRQYWSLNEIWGKITFPEYMNSKECMSKFKLTQEDFDAWETNGESVKDQVKNILVKKRKRK